MGLASRFIPISLYTKKVIKEEKLLRGERMRYLTTYLDTDISFKFGNTGSVIQLKAIDGHKVVEFKPDDKVVVRIKSDKDYRKTVNVTTDHKKILLNTKDLSELEVGQYDVELWQGEGENQVIYPDEGFLRLNINGSALQTTGKLISSITLADFEKQFDELATKIEEKIENLPDVSGDIKIDVKVIDGRLIINGKDVGVDLSAKDGHTPVITVSDNGSLIIDGVDTNKSLIGPKGDDGAEGESAYQVALDNGFDGTEVEWLRSLHGEDGADGKDGNDGKDGARGKSVWFSAAATVPNSVNNYISDLKGSSKNNLPQVGDIQIGAEGNIAVITSVHSDVSKSFLGFYDYGSWIGNLRGLPGKSAYDSWLEQGNSGTEEDFLNWLKGKDADISKFYTKEQISLLLDNYAKKSDVPQIKLDKDKRTIEVNGESLVLPKEIDLSGYASKDEIPNVALDTATRELTIDKSTIKIPDTIDLTNFLTIPVAEQKYALKESIPDVSGFIDDSALTPYAKKTDIKNITLDTNNRKLVVDDREIDIPSSVNLTDYATKQEIPKIVFDKENKALMINDQQVTIPDGVDLSNVYTKSEIDKKLADAASGGKVDLSGYVTLADAEKTYAKASELSDYAKKSELPAAPDLSGYAKLTDIPQSPDLSGLATKQELPQITLNIQGRTLSINGSEIDIPNKVDLTNYATKDQLPIVSLDTQTRTITIGQESINIPTSVDLSPYYTKEQVDQNIEKSINDSKIDLTPYLTSVDADKKFATKEELPDMSKYAQKAEVPSAPDLAPYAKKSDLPDMTKYAQKAEIPAMPDLKPYAKINDLPKVELDIESRKITINSQSIVVPQSVDLSNFATKSELPAITLDVEKRTIKLGEQSLVIPVDVDLTPYYTRTSVDSKIKSEIERNKIDLTPYLSKTEADKEYAKKVEIPDVSGLAKKTDVPGVLLNVEARTVSVNGNVIKIPEEVDISKFVTKTQIPNIVLDKNNRTISINGQSLNIPNNVDLGNYYTKAETDGRLANKQDKLNLDEYAKSADVDSRGINVQKHGLIGDGTTNNTEAMKKLAAWADQQPGKTILFFPPGTYLWDSTVQFNEQVELTGTENSWLQYNGTGTGLLLGKDGLTEETYLPYRSFTVKNLCFTGGENSQYLIQFNNFITQARVDHCQFHNAGGRNHGHITDFCIHFNADSWDGRVINCQFDVTKDGGQRQFVDMDEYGNSRVVVADNLVTSLSGFGTAVFLNGTNNQAIRNKIEGFQTNVRLGAQAHNSIVAFNYFEKNGNSMPSAAVEIGNPNATTSASPRHVYIAHNYAGLHNKSGKMYSTLVGPSSNKALLRDVLLDGNFVNAADWTAQPAEYGYLVRENNLPGQVGNHANNNYLGQGIKDILDTRTENNVANVREAWSVLDSSQAGNVDLSDYMKKSELAALRQKVNSNFDLAQQAQNRSMAAMDKAIESLEKVNKMSGSTATVDYEKIYEEMSKKMEEDILKRSWG